MIFIKQNRLLQYLVLVTILAVAVLRAFWADNVSAEWVGITAQQTFKASADTYLASDPAWSTNPRGASPGLFVGFGDGNNYNLHLTRSLVRFDPGLDNVIVSDVKVRMYLTYFYGFSGQIPIEVRAVTSSWQENVATWASAPSFSSAVLSTVQVGGSQLNSWIEWPVPPAVVQEWIDAPSTNNGLIFISPAAEASGSDIRNFYSKEGSSVFAPELIISYTNRPTATPTHTPTRTPTATPSPTPTPTPGLALHLSNDPKTEIDPGESVTYTITYVNNQISPLQGVRITNTIPISSELLIDSITHSGFYSATLGPYIVWDLGTIETDMPSGQVGYAIRRPVEIQDLQIELPEFVTVWDAISITATVVGGSNIDYEWRIGDGAILRGNPITHEFGSVGKQTVMVTASNLLEPQSAFQMIDVRDRPIQGLGVTDNSPAELNHPVVLTMSVTSGTNISYTWSWGDHTVGYANEEVQAGVEITASHVYSSQVGDYTVTITATNGVSQEVDKSIVPVDQRVRELKAQNNSPTILGQATDFFGSIGTGSRVTYTWDFGDNLSGATGGILAASHVYSRTGLYTATLYASNSLGTTEAKTPVRIVDAGIETLTIHSSAPTLLGSATYFTATIQEGTNVGYTWNPGDGSSPVDMGNGLNASFVYTYPIYGDYMAIVTATNGVSTSVASTLVRVDESIGDLTLLSNSPVIFGDMAHFTATILAGSRVHYSWLFGDSQAFLEKLPQNGLSNVISHTYGAVGGYEVVVTATNSVGSVEQRQQFRVVDEDIRDLELSVSAKPWYVGQPITATAKTSSGTNVLFQWFVDNVELLPTSSPALLRTFEEPGVYVIAVVARNSETITPPKFQSLTVMDRPIVGLSLSNSGPVVSNHPVSLTAVISTGTNVSYTWEFGDNTPALSTVRHQVTHVYFDTGEYTVTVSALNGTTTVPMVATTRVVVTDVVPERGTHFPFWQESQELSGDAEWVIMNLGAYATWDVGGEMGQVYSYWVRNPAIEVFMPIVESIR